MQNGGNRQFQWQIYFPYNIYKPTEVSFYFAICLCSFFFLHFFISFYLLICKKTSYSFKQMSMSSDAFFSSFIYLLRCCPLRNSPNTKSVCARQHFSSRISMRWAYNRWKGGFNQSAISCEHVFGSYTADKYVQREWVTFAN